MFVVSVAIALATWHANDFTINVLLSLLIALPAGGSELVKISLALRVSDHYFVEFLPRRKFVFLSFFPCHFYFGIL